VLLCDAVVRAVWVAIELDNLFLLLCSQKNTKAADPVTGSAAFVSLVS